MKPRCAAFTLIELLIVVAILGIMSAGISQVVVSFHRTSRMVLHEERARSVLQSEKEWIVAGPEPVQDEAWLALPIDPPLFVDIPGATGEYRFSHTEIPDVYRLAMRLSWQESLGPARVREEWLVYRPARKEAR